jgi:hypothetical protein
MNSIKCFSLQCVNCFLVGQRRPFIFHVGRQRASGAPPRFPRKQQPINTRRDLFPRRWVR